MLSDVWDFFDEDIKRAFEAVSAESDRVRTSKLLGALAEVSGVDQGGKIINDIRNVPGVELDPPGSFREETGDPPEVELSPCVRETLQFFSMHNIRGISVANLAMRLLQLGRGSTVMALEREGELSRFIERLQAMDNEDKR